MSVDERLVNADEPLYETLAPLENLSCTLAPPAGQFDPLLDLGGTGCKMAIKS